MRVCRKCKIGKEIIYYSRHSSYKDRLNPTCKECCNSNQKQYYAKNKDRAIAREKKYRDKNLDKIRAYGKDYRTKNKDKIKNRHLKRNYGISIILYNQMLAQQNEECLICSKKEKLHVDHCHKTGKVRGLLCSPCNTAIGLLKDSVETCYRAAKYLDKYQNSFE